MKNTLKNLGILALIVAVLPLQSVFAATSFSDVGVDHENYDAVEYLKGKGIIEGFKDGTFKPGDPVTRAEATKIITKAFNIASDKEYAQVFPDVKKSDWFFSFIMAGKEKGLVKGYEDGSFKPLQKVLLSETLKMVFAAGNIKLAEKVSSDVFTDVKADSWYAPQMIYAHDNNIVLSDFDGKAFPDKQMTRGSFSEIVYRTMTVLESGKAFPLSKKWATYDSPDMPFKIKYNAERWQLIKGNHDVVFYDPDDDLQQFSPTRIYPNSAKMEFLIDKNDSKMTAVRYFANIKTAFPDAKYTEFKWNNLKALEVSYTKTNSVDWYIYLNSGYVLVMYSEYGTGPEKYRFPQIIGSMLASFEYKDQTVTFDEAYTTILDQIFKNIMVENKGMASLNLLPDKTVVETDAIGVGTGPVDYYYSEGVNYTFKYERKSDVILDKRQGRTSAF